MVLTQSEAHAGPLAEPSSALDSVAAGSKLAHSFYGWGIKGPPKRQLTSVMPDRQVTSPKPEVSALWSPLSLT